MQFLQETGLEHFNKRFFFFTDFKSSMFHNNIMKISRNFEQEKHIENLPYRYCILCRHFYYGEKVKIFDFFKPLTRIKLFVHR